MFVLLKKKFQGQEPGARIDVPEENAKSLCDAGIAEPVKGNLMGELAEKALEGAMGNLTAGLEAAVEKQLKAFSQAMTKSRKNATPLLFGENGEGDPKGMTFGKWLLAVRSRDQKTLEECGSRFIDWIAPEGKAAMNTQTGTQGGFTVPTEFLPRLMQLVSEASVVRPRATIIPMGSKKIQVPALDVTTAQSAGTTPFLGGLVATWTEEVVAQTETEPTFKQIELEAYELSGYSKMSNALMADNAVGLESLLMQIFSRGISWYEDYAGVGMAIGAAFGGALGVTATSGPGICLKSEAIGLAVMTELPLIIIDVQRGGPSTGLPTKTEQADLLQAMFGRNGECPAAVVAARSPADCFNMVFEAARIAVSFMTPVFLLTDGYIANGAEPWMIPNPASLPKIVVKHPTSPNSNGNGAAHFLPYKRDERLVRQWAIPGTPGLEHRIGGIEKEDVTGNVCYDPINHEHMVRTRAKKIANIAFEIPELEVESAPEGDLLVVGWGGTYGALKTAVDRAQRKGQKVGLAHFSYLNPFPRNTGEVLKRFKKVLVPELNAGQLRLLLRAEFLVDAVGLNKIQGKPFLVSEIEAKIEEMLR